MQRIFVVQTLAAQTAAAAMIAQITARLHAAMMGAVTKIAAIPVAKAENAWRII